MSRFGLSTSHLYSRSAGFASSVHCQRRSETSSLALMTTTAKRLPRASTSWRTRRTRPRVMRQATRQLSG